MLWTLPVRLFRRATQRDGWTVIVFEVRPLRDRRQHAEHVTGQQAAIDRADALVETLEDRAPLRRPER